MRSAVEAENLPGGSFCPRPNRIFVLVAAILASALGFIDGSIVAIAIPAIRADLGASLADAQWISNAYALMLSALILTGGAAGDRFGLRNTFAVGIAAFIVASVLCAIAPGPGSLIAARGLQGIGAAIMVPGSLAIIAKAYPKNERGKAIGIWAAASALTTALGPVAGGFLLAFDDRIWRLIFAVNLPLGGLAIYLLLVKVPADAPGEMKALDLPGALLAAASLGALAYGLTAMMPESGEVALGFLLGLVGAGLMGIFLFWEARQSQPLVDLSLFRVRTFAGANVATFLIYFALAAILFYLPMLLIGGWGLSPASAGFIFLPLSVAIAVLSGFAGRWSDRAGARLPIAVGSLLAALAFAGLAVLTGAGIHRFWSGVLPLMVLFGLGMALVVSPLSTAIMTAVADEQTGSASGINNAVSRVAGLMAVAAVGAVAAWRYASVAGEGTLMQIPGFGQPATAPLTPALETLRIAANDLAFAAIAWITAGLCLAAAITAAATVSGKVARTDPAPPRLEQQP